MEVPSVLLSQFESELLEQPEALERLLERQQSQAADVAALLARDDVAHVLIASRGSSSNAARYAQYILGRASRVPVMFATPSLYTLYRQPPSLAGALVIGISQSGASPDIVEVLAEARRQGRPTVAITNDLLRRWPKKQALCCRWRPATSGRGGQSSSWRPPDRPTQAFASWQQS
jgi:fructoselysine-6-P-deglycase FrlB-like protein